MNSTWAAVSGEAAGEISNIMLSEVVTGETVEVELSCVC